MGRPSALKGVGHQAAAAATAATAAERGSDAVTQSRARSRVHPPSQQQSPANSLSSSDGAIQEKTLQGALQISEYLGMIYIAAAPRRSYKFTGNPKFTGDFLEHKSWPG